MKKLYVLTTLLFLSCIGFAQADLVITEISYNGPESGTDSTEFVEIYNNGTNAINLNNYYFSSGIVYTFPNISINAGAYLVIAFDSVALMNVFGVNAYQWTTGGLSNGGEPLAIRDNNGLLIDTLSTPKEAKQNKTIAKTKKAWSKQCLPCWALHLPCAEFNVQNHAIL